MAFEQTRFTRPLSRLELALAVTLIGIFMGIFVQRVILLTVAAEATAVELMIRNLRTGMMLYVSSQLLEGREDRIEELAQSDPFTVMNTPYGNFGGVISRAEVEGAESGQWFYDRDDNELVYKIVNRDYFSNENGTDLIRLKVKLNYEDRNHNGSFEHGIDRPTGVSLKVVDSYQWTY